MLIKIFHTVLYGVVCLHYVTAVLPSYIKVCKKSDPNLSKCIINSIEHLRPKLAKGIPELNIPPMEPLPIGEIALKSGPEQTNIKANISNLKTYGASMFKILDLKPDAGKPRFLVQALVPTLYFEGDYDIDMNFLLIKYKGKGPITGNFTDYKFNLLLNGNKVKRGNKTYVNFTTRLTLQIGKSLLHLGNLFGENAAVLGEATNQVISENVDVFVDEIRPALEKSLAEKLTSITNSISSKFTYDELFPEK